MPPLVARPRLAFSLVPNCVPRKLTINDDVKDRVWYNNGGRSVYIYVI